jgi:antitoxin ParD1/3/4
MLPVTATHLSPDALQCRSAMGTLRPRTVFPFNRSAAPVSIQKVEVTWEGPNVDIPGQDRLFRSAPRGSSQGFGTILPVLRQPTGEMSLPFPRDNNYYQPPVPQRGNAMASSVNLGEQLEAFITEAVKNGRYGSRSEVLREGVRLVEEREAELERFRAEVQKGIDDADAGRVMDADEAFDQLDDYIRGFRAASKSQDAA